VGLDLGGRKLSPASAVAPAPAPITLDSSPVGPVPDDLLALRPEPDRIDPEPEARRWKIAKAILARFTDEEFEQLVAEERAERARRGSVEVVRTNSGEVFNQVVKKKPIVFETPEYLRRLLERERMEPPSVAHETSAGLNGATATGEKEPG
jgi:hypothetical protein